MTIKDWIQTYARELEGSDAERELEAIVNAARFDELNKIGGLILLNHEKRLEELAPTPTTNE